MPFQNQAWETNLLLSLNGVPSLGVTFEDLTCVYKAFGGTELITRTLTSADWVELGNGFYVLKWEASYLNTLGEFFYTLTAAEFDNFLYDVFDVDPVPPYLMNVPGTCLITGNIFDIFGQPGSNEIFIQAIKLPTYVGSSAILSGEVKKTFPDADGNFSMRLLQGMTAEVSIQGADVRYPIVVPNAPTALLVSLLPAPTSSGPFEE